MEMNDKLYNEIVKLSEKGDKLSDKEKYEEAIKEYRKALDILPEPVYDWEAATWLMASIGDMYFQLQKFDICIDYFFEAQKCPDGIGNPFICVRIGECFYEMSNFEKSKEYLLQAYMLAGDEIFLDADPKYFEVILPLIEG